MTWFTQSSSIGNFIPKLGVCRPRFDVVSFYVSASLITYLTRVIISLEYCLTPFIVEIRNSSISFWHSTFPCIMQWTSHSPSFFTFLDKFLTVGDSPLFKKLLTKRLPSFFFPLFRPFIYCFKAIGYALVHNLKTTIIYLGCTLFTASSPDFDGIFTTHLFGTAILTRSLDIRVVICRKRRELWKYDAFSHNIDLRNRFMDWLDSLKFYPHFLGESHILT